MCRSSLRRWSSAVRIPYVDDLVQTNTPIFYTSCQSKEEKSVLFFKLGSNEGLLVELEGDAIVNTGTIQVKQGKVIVEETHGGVYSYQRVSELAKYMLTLNFTF
jgi:GH15 family glucan-1,4-alpha-glucosidase